MPTTTWRFSTSMAQWWSSRWMASKARAAVNLTCIDDITRAVAHARQFDSRVLLESFHAGFDLRIVVIGYEVVAAANPPPGAGTGRRQALHPPVDRCPGRRRQAATGGESRIPLDDETERTLRAAGFGYDDVLPTDQRLAVWRTANLHTGGTGRCDRTPAPGIGRRCRARCAGTGDTGGGAGLHGAMPGNRST